MNPENLKWIDVSGQIKTHADLKPGDLFVSARQEDPPKGALLKGTRVSPEMPWDQPGMAVLRRWDRLDKKPFTVELEYVDDSDGGFYSAFVEVDGALPREVQLQEAIHQTKAECFRENGWVVDEDGRTFDDLKVVSIFEGHIYCERNPEE